MDRISLQVLFSRTGFLGISRMPLEESTPGGSLPINVNIHYFYFTEIAFLRGQCFPRLKAASLPSENLTCTEMASLWPRST